MNTLTQTKQTALNLLQAQGSRSDYARDVIRQRQLWSGADLQGNARRWSASYAKQRRAALGAWLDAGGCIVRYCRAHVSAVIRCTDDMGHAWLDVHGVGLVRADSCALIVGMRS